MSHKFNITKNWLKREKDTKRNRKGMDDDRREYEAELKECEKEWKAERASSDYKNELKEYEKQDEEAMK